PKTNRPAGSHSASAPRARPTRHSRAVTRRNEKMNRYRLTVLATAVTIGLPAAAQTGTGSRFDDFVPVTDAMLQNPDPADWLSWRRTLDGWGYSPLDQIDQGNAGELEL